jgi:hypothetical protein
MDPKVNNETLDLVKQAQGAPNAELAKAWTQSGNAVQGITAYDLEAPAKKLYPVITPLRNRIPRVSGRGGIQANWRAVTGININGVSAGVGQGNRGGAIATSVANQSASYAGLGLEDYVTFEADYSAEGFDDVKALAVEGLLRSLMIQEERIILGGNNSLALGTAPTPTLSALTTGGSITGATGGAKTIYVNVVALTLEGYLNASVSAGVPGEVTRTNTDGSTDTYGGGSSQPSAQASQVCGTSTDTNSVRASVTPVDGAVAYAWYWSDTTGQARLGAITTINSYVITTATNGTNQLASSLSSDESQNSLVFDGLFTQIMKSGSNSYVYEMDTGTPGTGTPLTGDGAGGIVEIDDALRHFWDEYRLSPTDIYVGSQELKNISAKVLAGAANAAQRFTFNVDQGMIAGGVMVRSYLNKFTMNGAQEIPIRLHPNIPPGVILFYCDQLPYPLSNVPNVLRILARRDYYQIEWPLRSRKYEYGVYCDEVLQNYFTPAFGMIRNIANG